MKRAVAVVSVFALVVLAAGLAYAQMGWGPHYGMGGPGMMGWMGPGMMGGAGPGGQGGGWNCPAVAGGTAVPVTADKAKEAAQEYANEYLKGFTVEKVLPFTTPMGWTGYSVELKGPKDEARTLHVNPWGNVMPFGGPWRRAG